MDYDEFGDDQEPNLDWAKESMTFAVKIANAQEDFFVREIADRLAERVSREALERIDKTANELIEKRLRDRMDAIISDVLEKGLSTEVQPSDLFSNPKGEPITPAEFIAQGAEKFLSMKVDAQGNPVKQDKYGNSNRSAGTVLEVALAGVVTRQFSDEINAEVRKMTIEIRDQMKSAAAEWLAKFQAETVTGVEKAKALASRI